MSKQEMYEERLKLLQGIAARQGLTDVYDAAVARDVEVLDEDADTVVNLPDDPDAAKDQGPQNGEGSSRAEVVDPDERALFLRSRQEEAQEFRNWENFSYVAPGFGLGGPKYNTLQRANELTERRRFRNVRMPPARQQVKYPARPIEMRGYEAKQPMMIPIYQGDFGEVHYEDAYHNDYQQGRRVLCIKIPPTGVRISVLATSISQIMRGMSSHNESTPLRAATWFRLVRPASPTNTGEPTCASMKPMGLTLACRTVRTTFP